MLPASFSGVWVFRPWWSHHCHHRRDGNCPWSLSIWHHISGNNCPFCNRHLHFQLYHMAIWGSGYLIIIEILIPESKFWKFCYLCWSSPHCSTEYRPFCVWFSDFLRFGCLTDLIICWLKVPEGLTQHVVSSKKAQANWYRHHNLSFVPALKILLLDYIRWMWPLLGWLVLYVVVILYDFDLW